MLILDWEKAVKSKPKEFLAYWSPEDGQLKAGGNYGCVDGWEELTLIEKSAYHELAKELNKAQEEIKTLEVQLDNLEFNMVEYDDY